MSASVTLQLRGATNAFSEELDEDVLTLASGALPLVWLSLLTEADLERPDFWESSSASRPVTWTEQVRAAFTGPDMDRIPALEVTWPVARRRLRSAVAGLQARSDPWADPVARWETHLVALAAQRATLRAVLDLGPETSCGDADAFLGPLVHAVRWWSDPDHIPRPHVSSSRELTGDPPGAPPVWQAGRAAPVSSARRPAARERAVDASLVVTLSMATLMTFWLTGSVEWASAAFLLVVAGIVWNVFRRQEEIIPVWRVRPDAAPFTVRPPTLSVLVCALLLLGGLLDLWTQLHRVQGPCCSRAYHNYWPSRSWTELWVLGTVVMLGVVTQTVRLRKGRVTVTWLFGVLRLSRPLQQVTVQPVTLAVPRTQDRVAGLRLRLGWLSLTVTEGQAGYAALTAACTERPDVHQQHEHGR